MTNQWTEGIHYYINQEGLVEFTKKYHLERGYCCGNGCRHCPYGYERFPKPGSSDFIPKTPDPSVPSIISGRRKNFGNSDK